MAKSKTLVELVEFLKEKIVMPEELTASQQLVWQDGCRQGVKRVRSHVRHTPSNPLPFITMNGTPEYLMEHDLRCVWVDGFNAPVKFVEDYSSRMINLLKRV